jgi:hypothetical protein
MMTDLEQLQIAEAKTVKLSLWKDQFPQVLDIRIFSAGYGDGDSY